VFGAMSAALFALACAKRQGIGFFVGVGATTKKNTLGPKAASA